MKKLITMIAVLAAITVFGSLRAAAATSYAVNEKVSAVLDDSGTLTVSGTGTIDQSPWYENDRYKIKKIVVSKGITSIGKGAFFSCPYVESASVNATVKELESGAFANCSSLKSITGMTGVTAVGDYTFQYCGFTSFTFPASVKTIGDGVFYGCSKLMDISLPASLEDIGTIGYQCYGLQNITVASDNKVFTSENGVLFNKAKTVLYCFPCGKTGSYTVPSTVKKISKYAFTSSKLSNVTVSSGVQKIEEGAFFQSLITSISLPDSVTSIGDFCVEYCTQLESATLGNGLKALGYSCFRGDSSLKTVTLGKNITDLDTLTFVDCTSLNSINIPSGVSKIGGSVFYNCSSLTEITLPEGLKSIDGMAFLKTGLTSVTIPKNVTYVAHNAFPSTTELNILGPLRKQNDGSYMYTKNVPIDIKRYYDLAFEVLAKVNEERAKKELGALKMDKDLLAAAMLRAAETTVYWDHTRPTGMSCFTACDKMYAENIAVGSRTAAAVMNQWMNSAGHRANILSEDNTCIGIGVVSVGSTYYWVQCFGYNSTVNVAKQSSYSNNTDTVQVTVRPDFDGFVLKGYPESVTLDLAETQKAYMYVYNSWDRNYLNVDYLGFQSANRNVCTVNSKGIITALGFGSTTVKIYLKSEPELYVEVPVKVNMPKPTFELSNSTEGITIKIDAIDDVDGYYIYRKTADTSWVNICTIGATDKLSYTDTEVKDNSGEIYYYTVRAFIGRERSPYYTFVCQTRLTTPQVTLANGTAGISVKWSKTPCAQGYYIYRKLDGGKWEKIATANANATSYADKSIKSQSGKVYYYTVKAYSDDGDGLMLSAFDATAKIRWLASPAISLANATAGVTVSWTKTAGATGYNLFRKTQTGSWTKIASLTSGATVKYTDKNAKAGTAYYYAVRAFSADSASSYFSNVSIKRLTTPTVKLSNLNSGINVKWAKTTGAAGYYVYRKTATGKWQKIKQIKGVSNLSFTDTSVKTQKGVTYYYTVRAYSGSSLSNFVTNAKIKRT